MKQIKIFGYGSLINEQSLRKTVPNAKNIKPCKLYGFVRVFNIEEKRFSPITNKPKTVLNIEKSEFNQYVNGISFEISMQEFQALQEREKQYEIVQAEIENYENKNNISKAMVFRVKHFEAFDYQYNNKDQENYLNICLEGSKEISKEFYNDFLKTTFIGKQTLEELKKELNL